ncbi:type IV secretion system DNA-binding domain-containing protein [Nocardia sp. NPDC050710]|uniref:type IV secretory system conjugative DNA transfer family protein n=1 Tax=Nocardia sp. NPDC050710 TaxID=3157220 RepID=UPI0033F73AC9
MPTTRRWTIGVGAYDDDAVHTLPGQLDLLRALHDLGDPGVALVYRLRAEMDEDDELVVLFDLSCVSASHAHLDEAQSQSLRTLGQVALLQAYNLHRSVQPGNKPGLRHLRIVPRSSGGTGLPIKSDWAGVVDLVRSRGQELSIEMVCTVVTDLQKLPADTREPYAISRDAGTDMFSASARVVHEIDSRIMMTTTIHSPDEIDQVFGRALGRTILGTPVELRPIQRFSYFPSIKGGGLFGYPEEIFRAWHAPYGNIQGRGLGAQKATSLSIRFRKSIIGEGSAVGTAISLGPRFDSTVDIRIGAADRAKHLYIIGKTGSGKTNLLKNIALQDVQSGHGVAIIDPHGELCDHIIEHAGDRLDDIVLLDFGEREYLPTINPLTMDVRGENDYKLAVEELLQVIVRRSFNEFTGPVFEDTTRMMFYSVFNQHIRGDADPTIPLAVELMRTGRLRGWVKDQLREVDVELCEQWETFDNMLSTSVAENARWVNAKFADFANGSALQRLTATPGSKLSIDEVYEQGKILLVKLPETTVGLSATKFLGSIIFTRLYRAARRGDPDSRRPFYIHVDEFQRFVGDELEELVAEARKFKICLTFAHQNLKQLESFSKYEGSASARLAEAIFSNVGSIIALRTSGADVGKIAQEFSISERAVRNVGQYEAIARCSLGGTEQPVFTLRIPPAVSRPDETSRACVRQRMIDAGFWSSNEVLARADDRLEELRKKAAVKKKPPAPPTTKPATVAGPGPAKSAPAGGSSMLDEWLQKREQAKRATNAASGPPDLDPSKSDSKGDPA